MSPPLWLRHWIYQYFAISTIESSLTHGGLVSKHLKVASLATSISVSFSPNDSWRKSLHMYFRAQIGEYMTAIERKVLIFHRRMAQCM